MQGDDIVGAIGFSVIKSVDLHHIRMLDDNTPQHSNRFIKAANLSKLLSFRALFLLAYPNYF
jgi:hypothetical protein